MESKTINSSNFNQWQQKFLDGQLTPGQEEMLMQYLEANPNLIDLNDDAIAAPRLVPDEIVFDNKSLLKKNDSNFDGMNDFDFLAVKKLEENLTHTEESKLNDLIEYQPQLNHDLNLYNHTKLKADSAIVFANKSSLKRIDIGILSFSKILRYSSAAAVVASALWIWWPQQNNQVPVSNLSIAAIQSVEPADTTGIIHEKVKIIDSIEVEKKLPTIKQPNPEMPKIIEPYIEPQEPLIVALPSKNALNTISQTYINGYEEGINVMMPQYLDNKIEMTRLYAMEPPLQHHDNLSVKVLERGVKIFNILGINKVKLNKYYDEEGNIVAYKLKGDGLQWHQKVKP
jgi:hypothetical protein